MCTLKEKEFFCLREKKKGLLSEKGLFLMEKLNKSLFKKLPFCRKKIRSKIF